MVVRETQNKVRDTIYHKYNIYIPYTKDNKKHYANVYTCCCCKDMFINSDAKITEPASGVTPRDVPIKVYKRWLQQLDLYYDSTTLPYNKIKKELQKIINMKGE